MRAVLLVLLLAAGVALAGPEAELVQAMGGAAVWGELPRWRQEMIRNRYRQFLHLSEAKRESVRRRGLREYLVRPRRPFGGDKLPAALRRDLERVPPEMRAMVLRTATMRIRQLLLDWSLLRLRMKERWELFRRLYPEPFDPAKAHAASEELRRRLVKSVAARIRAELDKETRARGTPFSRQERRTRTRELLAQAAAAQERRLVERLRRELPSLTSRGPGSRAGRRAILHLERMRFLTPRQRELLRYALAPQDCPLLDLGCLGPKPGDPAARRLWESDYRLLARLELLSEAGFNREMLLHLASAGSPEDLLRAVQALRSGRRQARDRG